MGLISLNAAGIVATTPLFQNLTCDIGPNDRVGLVAGNGMGKTSLLRCIAGRGELSEGEVTRSRGLRVGVVEQDVSTSLMDRTLREAVLSGLAPDERDSEAWRVEVTLDELDAPEDLRERKLSALSGGWRRLALLARVWVAQPDALLLDEPTNHLDLSKIFQLEEWLLEAVRNIPVVIASHDRDFLDATTNRTLFLRPGMSHYFAVPYSKARTALAEIDLAAERQQANDLKQAKRLRQQAAKLTNIGINSGSDLLTVKAKRLKRRAAGIEEAVVGAHKERSGAIRLTNRGTHAKVMLGFSDAAVTTPAGGELFRTGKMFIFQGDRVVVLGPNGAGKTRLVRLIADAIERPDENGAVRVAPTLVPGYIDQSLSNLPLSATPMRLIAGSYDIGDRRARAVLADAGFALEKQDRPIGELSFGQRSRLALLTLRLMEPNFYLMDEPTNHVDIPGQEALEQEILDREATCVLVSHDRRFVRSVGTRFWLIEGRKLGEIDGPEPFFERAARQRS